MQCFYILLFICGLACAAETQASTKIVGGSTATIDNYPYVAALQYSALGILWTLECAGTLVSVNTVLTAAHCFDARPAASWRVRLGSSIATLGSTITIAKAELHPDYNQLTLDYDVALLRLAARTALGANIQTAWLAGRNFEFGTGAVVTALGWGSTQPGGSTSTVLQQVELDVVSQQICAAQYAALADSRQVTPRMLCAGALPQGGRGTCNGDDGGPIVYRGPNADVIVGITSWRYQCADSQYPEVHVRVSQFVDWIVQRTLYM